MVANATDNDLASLGEAHLYTYREPQVVRTPQQDGSQHAQPTKPHCEEDFRCKRIWDCQTCHSNRVRKYRGRIWEQLKDYPNTQRLAITIKPSSTLLAGHTHQGAMLILLDSVSHLFRKRSQQRRRVHQQGLAMIEYAAFYPHFLDDNGSSYPHLHGILAVSQPFDYGEFVDTVRSECVDIFPTEPDEAGEEWPTYMIREFLETSKKSKDLTTLNRGMALYFYGRSLLRATRKSRCQLPTIKQVDEDSRWSWIVDLAATLSPPTIIGELLTLSSERLGRICTIAKLMKAASVHECGEGFTVPTRRLAGIIGKSESQVREDLRELESIGIIRKLAASHGKPTEYVYEESHCR